MVRLQTVHHQTPHFRYSNGTEDVGASEHRSTGSNTFWKRFVFFIFSSFSLRKRPPQALRRAFSFLGEALIQSSSAFAGSFAPMSRFEEFEIHKGCLHSSNLALVQNLSPNALAD